MAIFCLIIKTRIRVFIVLYSKGFHDETQRVKNVTKTTTTKTATAATTITITNKIIAAIKNVLTSCICS